MPTKPLPCFADQPQVKLPSYQEFRNSKFFAHEKALREHLTEIRNSKLKPIDKIKLRDHLFEVFLDEKIEE